jgi:hypothetical protein
MVSPGLVKALTKSKKASQLKGILKKFKYKFAEKAKIISSALKKLS